MKGIVAATVVTFGLFTLVGENKQPFRLVSDQEHEEYLNELPATDDPALQAVYRKPLIFYTEKEMPRAYQDAGAEENPAEPLEWWRLRDIHPSPSLPFLRARLDVLAPISAELVRKGLSLPFRRSRGWNWIDGGSAPTTKAPFHIVPKEYDAG